ncbi:MAG TPA: TlpA disulfide reductase family protein [Anaerolineales bacterium]|nr:TlpA disulfide reductase family protein [Anaerolineales bacterium]
MTTTESAPIPAARPRPRWGAALVWVGVMSLLGLVGFGMLRTQQGPVGIGARVPDFSLTTFDGETINILEQRGRIVVVNFWASWCKPCEQEAAELEAAHRQLKGEGVLFLGVDWTDTEREALAYIDRFDITYPNGPDLGTRISQAFRIRGVPETYVVDPQGRLTHVKIGPFESLEEILDAVDTARPSIP